MIGEEEEKSSPPRRFRAHSASRISALLSSFVLPSPLPSPFFYFCTYEPSRRACGVTRVGSTTCPIDLSAPRLGAKCLRECERGASSVLEELPRGVDKLRQVRGRVGGDNLDGIAENERRVIGRYTREYPENSSQVRILFREARPFRGLLARR